ncbi:MAG: phage terminase large subunit family protein [Desulfurellales bacterium]|nr:MAG: phage terminase large subunit family protein [Desulfurellales bacterium]
MLIVEPRAADAEALSKERVTPMIRDTLILRDKFYEAKSRDSANTTLQKKFRGGHVTFTGAISPSGLAMRPVRDLACDEVDRYELSAGREGDPVDLAMMRTENFWNRKVLLCSTPTIEGASRIAAAYAASDQRYFFLPCPYCEFEQRLTWDRIQWPKEEPEAAVLICQQCEKSIPHHKKSEMLEHGRWIAQNPESKVPGFHLSRLYSPVRSWGYLAKSWLLAQDNQERRKVFTNTVLAETWKESGDAPDWEKLKARAESYRIGTVPTRKALFLTTFVDVQKDRLEVFWWAWGRKAHSWLIDHQVIDGDTSDEPVWELLSQVVRRPYMHPSGLEMLPIKIGVDAGYETTMAYRWCRRMGIQNHYPVFGKQTGQVIFWRGEPQDLRTRRGKTIKRGLRAWFTNTSRVKSDFYGWLNTESEESYGRVHMPQMPDHWLQQLTAEHLVTTVRKGYQHSEWQMVPGRERNEALDGRVGCQGLAEHVGLSSFSERDWLALESFYGVDKLQPEAEPEQPVQETSGAVIQAAAVQLPAQPVQPAQQPAQQQVDNGFRGRGRVRFRFSS